MSRSPNALRLESRVVLPPLVVVALGFGLRLYRLTAQSLSYDEAVSAYLAGMPVLEMLSWTAADVQPPLYYLLLRLWVGLAGDSEFALRFLSVAFSLLAVPVLYRLTLELARAPGLDWARAAAALAALAAAVHPWYVWHAQDARMYGLLLLAGALSNLALLRWYSARGRRSGGSGTLLALSYIGVLYTHYLGAGLLAAHALLVAWRAWQGRDRGLLASYVGRALVPAGLAFVPWLPAALRTVGTDASYWEGALKAGEAARKVAIALFVGAPGETVLESPGLGLAGVMFVALALALIAGRPRCSLPILGVTAATAALTGATFLLTPKFNPRYLMLASLGLPMLWGVGATAAWQRRLAGHLLGLSAVAALLAGSAVGLAGMYWDVRLTRADFRSAIDHIHATRQPDEPVLLVSGHMYPVWRYYAPDVPYVPLPDLRVLSVDSVIDLGVAEAVHGAVAQAPGAWVLLWQDEVIDPMGAVTFLLDQAGTPEQQDFWHVRLRHYAFEDRHVAPTDPPVNPPVCDFGGVQFLGTLPDRTGNLALLWQAQRPVERELRAQVTISDEAGHILLQTHLWPGGDHYPTTLWRPGQVAFVRYDPETPPGIPAGSYQASVSLYDAATGTPLAVLDAAGNPAGQSCRVEGLTLEGNTAGLEPEAVAAYHGLRPVDTTWPGARLVATGTCPTVPLPPGAELSVPLLWQAQSVGPQAQTLRTSLVDADGTALSTELPISPNYPPREWQPGEVVLDWLGWRLPPEPAPGPAQLRVAPTGVTGDGAPVTLCSVEVAGVEREYARPLPDYPSDAVAGGAIRLLGLDVDRQQAQRGGSISVALHFQALVTAPENYTLFLHLLGSDGRVWAGVDAEPAGRPTAGWLPGEVISLQYTLEVPGDAPLGEYVYEVGWFQPEVTGMPRLPVTGGSETGGDSVVLGSLYVR